MQKINMTKRVNFSGGLLGAIFGSPKGKVDNALSAANSEGWNLIEVIPDQRNIAIFIVRLIILILTLGLWTLSSGYLFIFEKPR